MQFVYNVNAVLLVTILLSWGSYLLSLSCFLPAFSPSVMTFMTGYIGFYPLLEAGIYNDKS